MILYHNLTQSRGHRNCHFRSTDIEQKNWKRLLWSVPDEMLYFLSQGKEICIIDKSVKQRNKIERIFVPVLNDILNWLYFKKEPEHKALKHHFARAKICLMADVSLMTKFRFWKKFIKDHVEIKARTVKVERELNIL